MMAFGKVEQSMLAAIVICIAYIVYDAKNQPETTVVRPEDLARLRAEAEECEDQPVVHSVRSQSNALVATNLILDLKFSVIPELELEESKGSSILDALFTKCKCLSDGNVYRWTLIMEQLDFVKTREDMCQNGKKDPAFHDIIEGKGEANATVAKVYVQKESNGNTACILSTVRTVLKEVLRRNVKTEHTYLLTVLVGPIQSVMDINKM